MLPTYLSTLSNEFHTIRDFLLSLNSIYQEKNLQDSREALNDFVISSSDLFSKTFQKLESIEEYFPDKRSYIALRESEVRKSLTIFFNSTQLKEKVPDFSPFYKGLNPRTVDLLKNMHLLYNYFVKVLAELDPFFPSSETLNWFDYLSFTKTAISTINYYLGYEETSNQDTIIKLTFNECVLKIFSSLQWFDNFLFAHEIEILELELIEDELSVNFIHLQKYLNMMLQERIHSKILAHKLNTEPLCAKNLTESLLLDIYRSSSSSNKAFLDGVELHLQSSDYFNLNKQFDKDRSLHLYHIIALFSQNSFTGLINLHHFLLNSLINARFQELILSEINSDENYFNTSIDGNFVYRKHGQMALVQLTKTDFLPEKIVQFDFQLEVSVTSQQHQLRILVTEFSLSNILLSKEKTLNSEYIKKVLTFLTSLDRMLGERLSSTHPAILQETDQWINSIKNYCLSLEIEEKLIPAETSVPNRTEGFIPPRPKYNVVAEKENLSSNYDTHFASRGFYLSKTEIS